MNWALFLDCHIKRQFVVFNIGLTDACWLYTIQYANKHTQNEIVSNIRMCMGVPLRCRSNVCTPICICSMFILLEFERLRPSASAGSFRSTFFHEYTTKRAIAYSRAPATASHSSSHPYLNDISHLVVQRLWVTLLCQERFSVTLIFIYDN